VSRFTQTMYDNAQSSLKGMITGEPDAPVRHTWGQVHERSRRIAGGLAAGGVGHNQMNGVRGVVIGSCRIIDERGGARKG